MFIYLVSVERSIVILTSVLHITQAFHVRVLLVSKNGSVFRGKRIVRFAALSDLLMGYLHP